jgi:hypothetical protein
MRVSKAKRKIVMIRLTDEQYRSLMGAAKAAFLPASTWARQALMQLVSKHGV